VNDDLSQLWWMFTIKGFLSIAFACVCYLLSSVAASLLLRPLGYLYLLVFFSFYVCMSGIILLVAAVFSFDFKLQHRRCLLWNAITDLVIGPVFLATFGLGFSFSLIVVLFGLHAAVLGGIHLLMAVQDRKEKRRSYILGLSGIVSLFAGICFILFRSLPPGRLTLGGAIYAGAFGLLLLWLSMNLRETHRHLSQQSVPG
jgi:uncharacterized membrane protein HdeD (DUF308 family)